MVEKKYISEIKDLMQEWDYEANKDLDPTKLTIGSKQKVWWKCKKCNYEWKARISNRTYLKRGCPFCSGSVLIPGKNDLATTHPEIAKEWHPTKNKFKPSEVRYGTRQKVWWICPHGHEYQATINHRTSVNGTQCPICNSGRQTSFAEQAFYYYIKKIRPDAISRYKADFLGKLELDIFIPSINVAIEYDGFAWHKENKRQREQKKYEICKANNIFLIRLREKEEDYYFDIADECICVPDLYKHENLDRFIPKVLNMVDNSLKKFYSGETVHLFPTYDVNIEKDRIKILKNYATECIKDSFGALYPEIAKEWHPIKNEGITPYMFKPNSAHKVWWICPECKNEYQSTIGHRIGKNPTACPKCGIEKSTQAKRKSINMIDPKTNQVIETFISISDASRKMKISIGNISAVCQGLRNKVSGYIWQYADEQEIKKHQKKKKQLEFEL